VSDEEPLLAVEGLEKHYPVTSGLLQRQTGTIRAVDGIDFTVREGETVGLIGESGCGKSTAASTVLRLEEPTGGTVRYRGEDVTAYDDSQLRRFRREAQVVFQNPADAFDPRMTVGESVAEPLRVQGFDRRDDRVAVVTDLLERVGLSADVADRYPHALSGGQKQRAALARALSVNPDLLIADEPVSALDVSVKAEMLALLRDLQADLDLGVLLISHDMGVVREVCDRTVVMYAGEAVERGPTESTFTDPAHPYTAALVDAVPTVDTTTRRSGGHLDGEVPDPANPPDGCRFHPRCPAVVQPEALDADQAVFRAVVDLRLALADGDLDRAAAAELAAAPDGESSPSDGVSDPSDGESNPSDGVSDPTADVSDPSEVDDEAITAAVRAEFDIPREMDNETLELAVAETLDALAADELDRARDRLARVTDSPCLDQVPETTTVTAETATQRAVDCHHHVADQPGSRDEVDVVRTTTPRESADD
jgi:peptide/nickel transport system ATP-binding protein